MELAPGNLAMIYFECSQRNPNCTRREIAPRNLQNKYWGMGEGGRFATELIPKGLYNGVWFVGEAH